MTNTLKDIMGAFVKATWRRSTQNGWAIKTTCAGAGTDADVRASRGNLTDVDADRILA